jgi:hypothetical protein
MEEKKDKKRVRRRRIKTMKKTKYLLDAWDTLLAVDHSLGFYTELEQLHRSKSRVRPCSDPEQHYLLRMYYIASLHISIKRRRFYGFDLTLTRNRD